jgi:hypothetical protein
VRRVLVTTLAAVLLFLLAPAALATTSTTSPYATSFTLCSGGTVSLTGSVHYVERSSESEYEFNYRLTGTNEATGDRYRLNVTVIGNFAGSIDEQTSVQTFIRSVRLIGLAGAESYRARALVQVTIVDGTVTASIERIETTC